eukprot:scaffold1675_cov454-Pavlova_lutheri.AAC.1
MEDCRTKKIPLDVVLTSEKDGEPCDTTELCHGQGNQKVQNRISFLTEWKPYRMAEQASIYCINLHNRG